VSVDGRPGTRRTWRPGALEALVVGALLLWLLRDRIAALVDDPALQTAATVFVAIIVQATPFLVMGVLLSAAITAFVPASFWQRALPRRPALAVPVAASAGIVLPGCECASVPVAGSLMARGVAPAAALAFLLAAPAINPIVIVSTLVAFPGQPEMAAARFVASLATAIVVGLLWLRLGKDQWIRIPTDRHGEGVGRGTVFARSAVHDLVHAGGFLVIGAMVAAAINVLLPGHIMDAVAANPVLSVLALAGLAVVLSICSEADAFVAASFTEFSPTAKLAFLVVGPMVDIKLVSMQAGIFGRRFAARFAPTVLIVAILFAVVVGAVMLG
jgi:uncharacterized membrane protein YraQ (UPF0718 family)